MAEGHEEALDEPLWADLDPKIQRRLNVVLGVHIPQVFRANRIIELQTGYSSEIGRNNLVDALSHLGTLAERGSDLTPEQQASQLSKIEEHLRRALIEHPEEVVRNRIAELDERWLAYQREASPYRHEGTLRGVSRHQELEELRNRIHMLIEAARSKKPDETTWDESLEAAGDMTQAANLTAELADKLEQCIGQAQQLSRERERDAATRRDRHATHWRWVVGLGITITLSMAGMVASYYSGKASNSGPNTRERQTSPPAPTTAPRRSPSPPVTEKPR